jgi:hypothetical protein
MPYSIAHIPIIMIEPVRGYKLMVCPIEKGTLLPILHAVKEFRVHKDHKQNKGYKSNVNTKFFHCMAFKDHMDDSIGNAPYTNPPNNKKKRIQ